MGTRMNVAVTADQVGLFPLQEGVLSFLASRSKSSARTLTPTVSEVFNGCAEEVSSILSNILETRNRADYRREFARSFSKDGGLTLAMSHVASALILREALAQLIHECTCG